MQVHYLHELLLAITLQSVNCTERHTDTELYVKYFLTGVWVLRIMNAG